MVNFTQVADAVPRALYAANGVQTAFPFSFPVFDAADMEVWVDRTRQLAGAYSISGIGVAVGGTVIFTSPPPAGTRVALRRRMSLKCGREFPDTAVEAWRLNNALYYQTAALQQVADDAALAVKRSFRSLSAADLTLPEPQAGRAIRWNDTGDGLVNTGVEVDTVMVQATARADAAAASASAAQSGRDAAAQSAAAAATARSVCDADVVVTGADRAAVATDKAKVASDRAAVQADRQAVDAAAATVAASATAVQTNAGSAAASAATAQAAATAASASQSAARASEVNAGASAGAARGSETNAAASASAAAASALSAQQAAGIFTFSNVAVSGQPTVVADQGADTLTLAAGGNISLATNAGTDTVTISVAGLSAVASSGAYGDLSGKPPLGTAAALNAGTAANNAVQLNASAQLPAVDGSLLTSLNASAVSNGTVAAARLGSGSPSSSTYLRGDGIWASLSLAPFSNVQTFTSSGTFTPPAGVAAVMVTCVGGGGGPSYSSYNGTNGGASSFGSLLIADGGEGGNMGNAGNSSNNGTVGNTVIGLFGFNKMPGYGNGVTYAGQGRGGSGAQGIGLCPVTPGVPVTVTVGAGGTGYVGTTSQPGIVIVRY